jgi:hypothetical protein
MIVQRLPGTVASDLGLLEDGIHVYVLHARMEKQCLLQLLEYLKARRRVDLPEGILDAVHQDGGLLVVLL